MNVKKTGLDEAPTPSRQSSHRVGESDLPAQPNSLVMGQASESRVPGYRLPSAVPNRPGTHPYRPWLSRTYDAKDNRRPCLTALFALLSRQATDA